MGPAEDGGSLLIRVWVRSQEPICGWAGLGEPGETQSDEPSRFRSFEGWLGLLRVMADLLGPPGAAPDPTDERRGRAP